MAIRIDSLGRARKRKDSFVNTKGYLLCYAPDHPNGNYRGYVYKHRLVVEKHLGRLLGSNELVHHKNANPLDNRFRNLEVVNERDHQRLHHGWKRVRGIWHRTCSGCKRFLRADNNFYRYNNFLRAGLLARGKAWNEYANICKPCYSVRARKYRQRAAK